MKWLIGSVHRTALRVVVPPITPSGYSPPVPGCCGASIATEDGSCSLPHAILGDTGGGRGSLAVGPAGFPAARTTHSADCPHTLGDTVTPVPEPSGSVEQRDGGVRCGVEQKAATRCGKVEHGSSL